MMRKVIAGLISGWVVIVSVLLGLIITGWKVGWGPFTFLQFDSQEKAIVNQYPSDVRKGEIIFYGASNFRLWSEMESDLSAYKVQNHGFGGSADRDLVERADTLLYPYEPRVVFFQTGSNDYVSLKGDDSEKIEKCMAYKEDMFNLFHSGLPEAHFVVMSGLLLPGRSEYTPLTRQINQRLEEYCHEHADYMTFVDAEQLTFDGVSYHGELFISDGIHLNRKGQEKWCSEYIAPTIESLITILQAEDLRR